MAVYRDIKVEIPKEHVTIERQKGGKPALIKYVLSAKFNREKGYTEPKRICNQKRVRTVSQKIRKNH